MSTDLQAFGKRLRALRQQRGLTQAELERLLPVSEGLVSRWERAYQQQGRQWKPDRQMLLRLLQLFADAFDEAEAQRFSAQAGYTLTRAELQALFPASLALSPQQPVARQDFSSNKEAQPSTSLAQDRPVLLDHIVGRAEELVRLNGYWQEAIRGQGRVAFVHGSAGSGKSSLVRLFAQQRVADHPNVLFLEGSCSAYGGYGTPYMPFREIARMLLGDAATEWVSGSTRHQQQARWQRMAPSILHLLTHSCRDLVESFVPAATLRDEAKRLQGEGMISPEQLQTYLAEIDAASQRARSRPQIEQQNLFEEYTRLLQLLSDQQPLFIFLDDLHWADAASLSLLFHLGRAIQGHRILLVGSYRTSDLAFLQQGTSHPLAPIIHEMQRIYGATLIDLDHSAGAHFVDAYLDSEPNRLGRAFRTRLLAHTRGHALFTVEMVRGMQERGEIVRDAENFWVENVELHWEKVPERIEGLIAQHFDRLPAHLREVLEVASIQGESFVAEVIAHILGLSEQQLLRALSADLGRSQRLVVEESVQRVGTQRLSHYRFRHLLFQSYLYNSLGKVERAYLHERVGTTLERLCGEESEPFTGQLARHFEEANLPEKAIFYLLQSGRRAMRLAAHAESIQQLRAGLALLYQLPPSPQRDGSELDLLMPLGISLIATKGYGAAEVTELYGRALDLTKQGGDAKLRTAILFNLWIVERVRSNLANAHAIAEQLMELAQQSQETRLLLVAEHALWTNSLYSADFPAAHHHAEAGIALYNAEEHHALTFDHGGHDPGVCSHIFCAYALWYLGYPEQARERIQAGIHLARTLKHPYSLAMVLTLGAEVLLLRRESEAALALLQEARPIAERHAFANWLELNAVFRGWALAELGEAEAGIAEIERGLAANRANVGEAAHLQCIAQLAIAYGKANQAAKGLELLDAALAVADKNQVRHWDQWEAELFRLQGELRWRQAREVHSGGEGLPEEEAQAIERSLWQAIEIARQQNARMPELRAVIILGRLWMEQGRNGEAHALLSESYSWFTEGFETMDLQEAATLLEQATQAASAP